LRLLGYSFIESPLESLFFEILKPFGNSLLLIAAMTYAKNNADIENMASLEGVMGALYFGVGKAMGSLVGGLVIEDIGVRNTFRSFSVVALVTASVYFCFTHVHEKRSKKEAQKDAEAIVGQVVVAQNPDQTEKGNKDEDVQREVVMKTEKAEVKVEVEVKTEDTRCT